MALLASRFGAFRPCGHDRPLARPVPPVRSCCRARAATQPASAETTPPESPAERKTPASPATRPRTLAIGLDLGTHASGYAYSWLEAPTGQTAGGGGGAVTLHYGWPDQPAPDAKTRSAILYRGTAVEAWGWTACKRWAEMGDAERRSGTFTYLEDIKLLLLDQLQGLDSGGGRDLRPILPPGLAAVQVVADFLSELRRYSFARIAAGPRCPGGPFLNPASIVWCLTLPAMWSEAAKAKMRQAASRAGMAAADDPGSLLLTLEPEAAALAAAVLPPATKASPPPPAFASPAGAGSTQAGDVAAVVELREVLADGSGQQARVSNADSSSAPPAALADGDVVLVLDCGGGTADLTLHRVVGSGAAMRLREAAVGTGVLAGARFADEAAWRYVRGLVGAERWDVWRVEQPGEWFWLSSKWEAAKRQAGAVKLQLPPGLVDMRPTSKAGGVPTSSKKRRGARRNAQQPVPFDPSGPLRADGVVVLSEAVLEQQVFGPVVDQVVAAAEQVLEAGLSSGNKCNKMLLVGGFANSSILQRRVQQLARAHGAQLLIPTKPGEAVVAGAVAFGKQPYKVSARYCRLTYGIACRSPWKDEDATSNSKNGYPRKIWDEEDRQFLADGKLQVYVRRGQLLPTDEAMRHNFYPSERSRTSVSLRMYATERCDAKYTEEPGMHEMASVQLELPPGWGGRVKHRSEHQIQVEIRFGSTEIALLARDLQSRNAVATSIAWAADLPPHVAARKP